MALSEKNIEDVKITLEDSVNMDDDMMTVSFNQASVTNQYHEQQTPVENDCQDEEQVLTGSPIHDATEIIEPDGQNNQQMCNTSFESNEPVSIHEYFMSTQRHRTTSDNEFFDHLAAGDSAMMADETVSYATIASADLKVPSSLVHCESAAKINVVSESFNMSDKKEMLDDEEVSNQQDIRKADNNENNAESEPVESKVLTEEYSDKYNSSDTLLHFLSDNSVEDAEDVAKSLDTTPSNVPIQQNQAESDATDTEEIPVFRYFAKESSSFAVSSNKTPFDDFPSVSATSNVAEADAFSAALEASESDRRHDAWIPGESTTKILTSRLTNSCNISPIDASNFTNPRLVVKETLVDPITTMLTAHVGEPMASNRRAMIMSENTVAPNEDGLRMLMSTGCHRAAVNLTSKLLFPTGESPGAVNAYLLQLWFCRIGLLIKLKMFQEALEESVAFSPNLDKPDIYYEFYPEVYAGRKGSMAPFGFRLLLAEIPRFVGQYQEALSRLYILLQTVKQINKNLEEGLSEDGSNIEMSDANRNSSKMLWHQRELKVLYSLVNAVTCHKDYSLAISLMAILIDKESDDKKPHLWSAKGRIYLQLGDISGAQISFGQAASATEQESECEEIKIMKLNNQAMICIAQNNFHEAFEFYKQASEIDPHDSTIKNNMAVCYLYMGELRKSLNLLEEETKKDPAKYLHEGILFNICTLYELESSQSTQKKLDMLSLTSQHQGDSFDTVCLKIG